jgi:hypothetical protein
MTDYKTIHGRQIKAIASDPPAAVGKGQVWYNSTSGDFKASVKVEAWSSGGAHPTANRHGFASGTQTAALYASGYVGPQPAPPANLMLATSFEYDGSSWTSGGNVNSRAFIGGSCGTQTASLKMGGNMPSGANRGEVEEYNGTSWAEQNDLPTGTQTNTGIGIQTAALSVSGGADTDITLEYDGASWTAGGNLSGSARVRGFGSGTQTAGMYSGGALGTSPYAVQTAVEQYDGSSWSSLPASLNTGQSGYTSNNVGTSSRDTAIVAGGHAGSPASVTGVTQIYDGSTWRTAPSMATARQTSLTGDSSAALAVAGGANITTVEEFSAVDTVKVITDS